MPTVLNIYNIPWFHNSSFVIWSGQKILNISILCLTTDPIHQGHEKRKKSVTSARSPCNTSAQLRDMAQKIVLCQKHNMLSLLHAACLKLLVFFFAKTRDNSNVVTWLLSRSFHMCVRTNTLSAPVIGPEIFNTQCWGFVPLVVI